MSSMISNIMQNKGWQDNYLSPYDTVRGCTVPDTPPVVYAVARIPYQVNT